MTYGTNLILRKNAPSIYKFGHAFRNLEKFKKSIVFKSAYYKYLEEFDKIGVKPALQLKFLD